MSCHCVGSMTNPKCPIHGEWRERAASHAQGAIKAMSDALKPCPVCGGEAVPDSNLLGPDPCHWIDCDDCGASTDYSQFPENCAEDWNRRASPISEELVGRIRKMAGRGRVRKAAEWQWGDVETLMNDLLEELSP